RLRKSWFSFSSFSKRPGSAGGADCACTTAVPATIAPRQAPRVFSLMPCFRIFFIRFLGVRLRLGLLGDLGRGGAAGRTPFLAHYLLTQHPMVASTLGTKLREYQCSKNGPFDG